MNFKYHVYSWFILRQHRSCYSEQKITLLKKQRDLTAPVLLEEQHEVSPLYLQTLWQGVLLNSM